MIARVYAYLSGGGQEPEIMRVARMVARFGVEAVYGRALTRREAECLKAAGDVNDAYWSREANKKELAKWAENNPYAFSLLNMAKWLAENG